MIFAYARTEVCSCAYATGQASASHARIKVRAARSRRRSQRSRRDDKTERGSANASLVTTTVGRVIFNDILPAADGVLRPARSTESTSSRIIADCYQLLGRHETIDLLDRMKDIGFRESTRAGLSFATDDLTTPPDKEHDPQGDAEKEVEKVQKQYERGIITERRAVQQGHRPLDARPRQDHQADDGRAAQTTSRDGKPYLNPIFLMAHSGARGGVEQIRQLAGMRGLMAKPSGEIIETPIKANFREGLTVLEYFSSTHGARKGLADTALKTADSGYLTRKLADVAQNVVITHARLRHDPGHHQGRHLQGRGDRASPGAERSAAASAAQHHHRHRSRTR